MNYVKFKRLVDGEIGYPSCGNYTEENSPNFYFEVDQYDLGDYESEKIGWRFSESDSEIDLVYSDGQIKKVKGQIVQLTESEIKPVFAQRKLLEQQTQLTGQAKALIAECLVKQVGSVMAQLNASTTTNPDVQKEWEPKFQLRDAIKFEHGRRLKDAITGAKTLDDLEKIKQTMTENYEGWANA